MICRFPELRFGFLLCFLTLAFLPLKGQDKTVNIGIVVDGPWQFNESTRQLFQKEILELTAGEFEVRFPENKYLVGDWTLNNIQSKLEQLLDDPEVDIVLAMGVIASNTISRKSALPKPVIAPFVIDVTVQGLPEQGGVSGVKNLNYIAFPSTIQRDVRAFLEIVPFKELTFFVNAEIYQDLPGLEERTLENIEELGVKPRIIPVRSIDDALNALNQEVEAVYVGPLLHIYGDEFDRLVEKLIELKIPSFSLLGRQDVERGILASAIADFMPKIARRVALNVQRILLGEEPGNIPYAFAPGEELTINVETARKIGVFPPWGVYTEAVKVNEEKKEVERRLTLQGAVMEGIEVNLDLLARNLEVKAGEQVVNEARSPLLPQIDLALTGVQINDERAGLFQSERTLTGQATLNQVIYADQAWTNYAVEKHLQRSLEREREALRLDIAQQVASAYLNVLIAKTVESIQQENLKLSRSNLELAQVREAVGFSGRAEVFRWEGEIAANRQAVIDANARRNVAEIQFNRLLNHPLEESFATVEVDIEEVGFLTEQGQMLKYMNNRLAFKALRNFFVEEGIAASPEIRQLDAAIAAQERLLKNTTRAFYIPDLVAQAEYSRVFEEGGVGADISDALNPDDPASAFLSNIRNKNNWSVALNLSYPLFSGGGKLARRSNALEALSQLRTERKALAQRIEQRVRSSAHLLGASYAAIRQSREAAEAAEKNLALVIDSYSQGVLDITQLLDAQNASLIANQATANSVYEFLIDLMELERALGSSYLLRTVEEREAFFERLDEYFERAGLKSNQ